MTTITEELRSMSALDAMLRIKDEADRKGVPCSMRRAQRLVEHMFSKHQSGHRGSYADPTANQALRSER